MHIYLGSPFINSDKDLPFMSKTVMIAAIAVAAIVVGGGVAAVILMGGQNGGDNSVSFDKRYFDIKGAQSLAIIKESKTGTSAASNIIYSTDSNGPAVMSFGDNTGEKPALYKKDSLGNYVKVKLYDTQAKAEEGEDEIKYDYSPVAIYLTDNGKYAYMIMGVYRMDSSPESTNPGVWEYWDVKSIVVSIETGKIYELPLKDRVKISSDDSMLSYSYYQKLLSSSDSEPIYRYIGCSGSVMFFRMFSDNEYHIYSAVEDNGELVLKEIINSTVISSLNSGPYKFYANGIIRMFSPNVTIDNNCTLIFADGKLKQKSNNDLFECGDCLCTSVTYNDPETKYFPSSATVITGYDEETKDIKTETRNFTTQQSYEMMQKKTHQNEISRFVDEHATVLITMNSVNSYSHIQLSDNLTSFVIGTYDIPFKPTTIDPNFGIIDDSATPGYCGYTVLNGHICQYVLAYSRDGVVDGYAPSDVVLDDNCLYKFASNKMNQYNVANHESKVLTVTDLFNVTTMEVDCDRVMITGFSESGLAVSGYLNFSDMSASLVKTNVMREVRIAALN